MNNIQQPFTNSFVVIYLDDILIFSKTREEHVEHVSHILNTMCRHKLQPTSSVLSMSPKSSIWATTFIVPASMLIQKKVKVIQD